MVKRKKTIVLNKHRSASKDISGYTSVSYVFINTLSQRQIDVIVIPFRTILSDESRELSRIENI